MPPGEQDGDAPGHELLRVGVAMGPEHKLVALPIPLPAGGGEFETSIFPKERGERAVFRFCQRFDSKRPNEQ